MLETVNGRVIVSVMEQKSKLVVRMTPRCKVSPCFHAMTLS